MEKLGPNEWCSTLSFVDLVDLSSFARTCSWAAAIIRNATHRDRILLHMNLFYIEYKDEFRMEEKRRIPMKSKYKQLGKLVLYSAYHRPQQTALQAKIRGFIKNTDIRFCYDGRPGRCDNFIISLGDDELCFNDSSHGTIYLSYNHYEYLRGDSDDPQFEKHWKLSIDFIHRLLQAVGMDTDFKSWKEFCSNLGISSYFWVFYHPDVHSLMKRWNTRYIYEWLCQE